MGLSAWGDFALEYALGFGFGWAYFQAFAMRDMVGGSYIRSLKETFIPELVSMNMLMAGMVPTMKFLMPRIVSPLAPGLRNSLRRILPTHIRYRVLPGRKKEEVLDD